MCATEPGQYERLVAAIHKRSRAMRKAGYADDEGRPIF
jgi:hypothetical protein